MEKEIHENLLNLTNQWRKKSVKKEIRGNPLNPRNPWRKKSVEKEIRGELISGKSNLVTCKEGFDNEHLWLLINDQPLSINPFIGNKLYKIYPDGQKRHINRVQVFLVQHRSLYRMAI